MFSGIVAAIGKVKKIYNDKIWTVEIEIDKINLEGFLSQKDLIKIGSSILCSGICLTVKQINGQVLLFDVSDETATVTNFKYWKQNSYINLERSLKVGDEIGGHFVSGHVDDIIKVENITNIDKSKKVKFSINDNLKKYIAEKGSVTLNGISLTVNKVGKNYFEVNIIPFTWENTNFLYLKQGSFVNLEIDILARYLLNSKNVK